MGKLTIKQRGFIKNYVNTGGNGTQAVLSTYNTKNPEVAKVIASENLTKPNVKEAIEQVLNRKGLDVDSISEPVKDILTTKPNKVDANSVLRAAEMLYKLHGAFPATKSARLNISVTEKYKDWKYQDLLEELRKTRERTEDILKDLGPG